MLDADDSTNDDRAAETSTEPASAAAETEVADSSGATKKTTAKKAAATKTAKKPAKKPAKKTAKKPAKKTATSAAAEKAATKATAKKTAKKAPAKKTAARKSMTTRAAAKKTAETSTPAAAETVEEPVGETALAETPAAGEQAAQAESPVAAMPLFYPPPATAAASKPSSGTEPSGESIPATSPEADRLQPPEAGPDSEETASDGDSGSRRRRRRGGRRRRKPEAEGGGQDGAQDDTKGDAHPDTEKVAEKDSKKDPKKDSKRDTEKDSKKDTEKDSEKDSGADPDTDTGGSGNRRRRRRRRSGEGADATGDADAAPTRARKTRSAEDQITTLTGSTRLEAKKQRRREGREAGRRRAPIVSEAEFLARREAVDRVMVIRQRDDLTQIAVLEDKVLVEHYVARESQTSLIGNVYLGRVQNVLPSMEAAFIDIGKGRNAVLYAGEVNWDAMGAKNGQQRRIESVMKSGQSVLVQVTKDPVGHKGARLTSQISLPGRFLVYVPDGTTSGISRKLPDTERNRLKTQLKEIVPDTAGVIVRTAAEGTSEQELTRDVERLTARWDDISAKASGGKAPQLLYAEADLTLKVVRDLFTEDFAKLVVSGSDAWDMVEGYVRHVAPDLGDRLQRYDDDADVFTAYRVDEQIAKGLDRKVWLPSGGSLIIDRTEAMTVVDVNTGKFTGSGGNLEETVTRNNLEAAEEMVRQLRLRDIGGIIVVDFIDMVLESNRDLVLRRLVECLGRDRTRHQVAEVTSLGLVQMTRKRIGTGLLEAFSETCEHCQGRGVLVHHEPVEPAKGDDDGGRNRRGGRSRGRRGDVSDARPTPATPTPKDVAALARAENADKPPLDEADASGQSDSARSEPGEVDQPDAVQPEDASGPAPREPEQQASAEPDEAPAPRVVTSVRRRGPARRPAGPPGGNGGKPAGTDTGPVLTEDPPVAPEQEHSESHATLASHVPVKRKGSRKR